MREVARSRRDAHRLTSVKSCPTCGARAGDDDVFCEVDGARLVAPSTAAPTAETPASARVGGDARCGACGAKDPDDGDGYCKECGHRLLPAQSTLTGAAPAKVGDFTVTRAHGEGDMVVVDAAGATRLLIFGSGETMREEAHALASGLPNRFFPRVVFQGDLAPLGHYLVVDRDVGLSLPLEKAQLSFPAALALARALLDAAAEVEAHGFDWEPDASDLHVTGSGALVVMRVRGARRLVPDDPLRARLNAKRVLEALGGALVPTPLALGTPALVRLFLPRSNFSTVSAQSIDAARAELARAEALASAKTSGVLAELCDPGLRKAHNEDATAVAEGEVGGEPFKVLVVCDGVSSSTHGEEASAIASKVACDALEHFARSGDILREGSSSAVVAAIRAAHVAVCTAGIEFGSGAPPGTTIVVALVFRKSLTVGWVGDSRAYWCLVRSPRGIELRPNSFPSSMRPDASTFKLSWTITTTHKTSSTR